MIGWWGLALAARPFPPYDEVVVIRTWERMDSLIEAACSGPPGPARACIDEPLDEAIALGEAFERHVLPDARIRYLIGLARRSKGDREGARRAYEDAVRMDPARLDAWHDLGELALEEGDLDTARRAFTRVADGIPTGPRAWLGPWRLAEVAAAAGDAARFEAEMGRALERGFSFRTIEGLPNWRRFLADPVVGPSVRKMITVYGSPAILRSLETAPPMPMP